MITHGNKQISELVYARKASEGGGAVRLTNIIRGAQVVFGGLKPDVKTWLMVATKAAILAAFGQTDGKAVIKVTNAYLNALAATDPTKASALAGFINEDPMLVCSLGLQPQGVEMPIRWLVNNDNAYIRTGITLDNNSGIYARFKCIYAESASFIGARKSVSSKAMVLQRGSNGNWSSRYGNSNHDMKKADENIIHEFSLIKNVSTIDSVTHTYQAQKFTAPGEALIYAMNNNGTAENFARVAGNEFKIWTNDILQGHYVPCKYNVDGVLKEGMLDLVNFVWYGNANTSGSFSIAYTLPDGTPWTPLNQTP